MKPDVDYTLYLVTDRELMSSSTIEDSVEQSIAGGCTVVQLREKDVSSREFYETALRVQKITSKYRVPLIINDRVDIAAAINADGVHIGQSDLPIECVRKIMGADKLIGVSAGNLSDALAAERAGADYLGVGAMYATGTKVDAHVTTIDELIRIRQNVPIPIVVIGGINMHTVKNFWGTGIDGLAVVSAIVAQKNVKQAACELKRTFLHGATVS